MSKTILRINEIKTITFIFEDEYTAQLIERLYLSNQYETFVFATQNDKLYRTVQKSLDNLKKIENKNKKQIKTTIEKCSDINTITTDAVFFDTKVSLETMQQLGNGMAYLFGHIWCDVLPHFDIWENHKNHCEKIFIQRQNKVGRVEVLDWEKTDNDIELSVVFPVYKVAEYLPKCIESVIQWQAPYVEFLFVNDGSPDNSAEIVREYQAKDSRIKLLTKENGGCASARKYGQEHAKGRYIGFIDPDDFIDPSMFKKLLSRAMMGGYQISYSGYNQYFENTKTVEKVDDVVGFPYTEGTTDTKLIRDLLIYRRIAIWRGIYRKDFLESNHITFNTQFRRFDDLPFKMETFFYAKSVVSVPEYLYYYRLDRPGQDVSCTDDRLYVHFDIFDYLDGIVEKINDQQLIDYMQVVKLQTHAFSLDMIDAKYSTEYARKSKIDLKKNCSKIRTLLLIKKHLSKHIAFFYLCVMFNIPQIYRLQQKYSKRRFDKKLRKQQATLKSLESFYQK